MENKIKCNLSNKSAKIPFKKVGDDVGYNPILPNNIDRYFQS
jgi:hypothetical protein